jgi:hypothetical protein
MHPVRVQLPVASPGRIAQWLVRHRQSVESAQASPNCEETEQLVAAFLEAFGSSPASPLGPPSPLPGGGTSGTQEAP